MRRSAAASRTRLVVLAGVIALACLSSPPLMAQEPMQVAQETPGFSPAMVYQNFDKGESVNVFNGGLVVSHSSSIAFPENLGAKLGLTRVYNSKLGDAENRWLGNNEGPLHGWAGVNWTLSLGRIYAQLNNIPSFADPNAFVAREQWVYQDESGTNHQLYLSGQIEPYPGDGSTPRPTTNIWYYTNDGSYLRAKFNEPGNTDNWRVYYPNGSTRILGGTNAYLAPDPHAMTTLWGLRNAFAQGWYTTSITDRAGNAVYVTYAPRSQSADPVNTPYAGAQPYMGAMASITDSLGRSITFEPYENQSEASCLNGLLKTITYTSADGQTASESFTYTPYPFVVNRSDPHLPPVQMPELSEVDDPLAMATWYTYQTFTPAGSSVATNPMLATIGYPTGGRATYTYDQWTYVYRGCPDGVPTCEPAIDTMVGVKSRTLHVAGPDRADNTATWTWVRDFMDTHGGATGVSDQTIVVPVIATDPLGQQVVHFFSGANPSDPTFPPGLEVGTYRYHQGTSYDRSSPLTGCVERANNRYAFLGGDAYSCVQEAYDTAPVETIPGGNSRVKYSQSHTYTPGGTELWYKTVNNYIWDGYGHFILQETTGTNLQGMWVEGRWYDLKQGPTASSPTTPYQLDRLGLSFSGLSAPGAAPPDSDDVLGTYSVAGTFKTVKQDFDDASFANAGLLSHRWQMRAAASSLAFDGAAKTITTTVDPGPTDPQSALTYSSAHKGNATSITYSGGQGGNPSYTANFTWSGGMVDRMQWTGYAKEFSRSIDGWGRIKSETDPSDLLTTTFSYDAIGRLTGITPPGGEDATSIAYPVDGGTGHTIQFYRGPDTIPNLKPGDDTAKLSPQSVYSVYEFDGLGRLQGTYSVMPDGTWNQQITAYGPLGDAVFSSSVSAQEPWSDRTWFLAKYPLANGAYVIWVPKTASGSGQGTWSSLFSDATASLPLGTSTATADDFRRPLWTINADGSRVRTQPDSNGTSAEGLATAVTQYERNAAPGSGQGGTSTTVYRRDALGKLRSVTPAAGASATYDYDGLGNLVTVALAGGGTTQTRTFSYDALGHLLSAINPENGTVDSMTYDALGHLLTYQDAAGRAASPAYSIAKTYDGKGRLMRVQQAAAGGSSTLAEWDYDDPTGAHGAYSQGKLTATRAFPNRPQGAGVTVAEDFIYDNAAGHLGRKEVTLTQNVPVQIFRSYKLEYSYYTAGQVRQEAWFSGSGATASFTVNSEYRHGALSSKMFGDNVGAGPAVYHPSMALSVLPYSNNTKATFSEDPAMARLSEILVASASGGTSLWDSGRYAYDGTGNITNIGYDTFGYDDIGRLASATVNRTGAGGGQVVLSYGYDAFGNLNGRQVTSNTLPGDQTDFMLAANLPTISVDTATNRIISINRNGTTESFPVNAYDANGNLKVSGADTFAYDPLNQTQSAIVGAETYQYFYDASGERAATVSGSSPDSMDMITLYLRNGAQVAGEERIDYNGTLPSSDTLKAYLYVGANLAATESSHVPVDATYSASGSVVMAGSGTPLPGVSIFVGSGTQRATTDAAGNFTIAGLPNGVYVFKPVLAGYTFYPTSRQETINGGNITLAAFDASTATGHCIAGIITTSAGQPVSGVTVAAQGAAPGNGGSTITGADGSYSICGLLDDTYTVTPGSGSYSFTPPSYSGATAVVLLGSDVTGKDFTAAPVGGGASISGTVTFMGSNTPMVGVTVNAVLSAYAMYSAVTDGAGTFAISGLPDGVYAVAPSKTGYQFIQQTATIANQVSVTGLMFGGIAVATYPVSGTVTDTDTGLGLSGVAIHGEFPTQVGPTWTTTDASGHFTLQTPRGTWTFEPRAPTGYILNPASRSVTVTASPVSGINFAARQTHSISGTVTVSGVPLARVTVQCGGKQALTDESGQFTLTGFYSGTYKVTPSKPAYSFSPQYQNVTIPNADVTGVNFTGTALFYSISGTLKNALGPGIAGGTVFLSQGGTPRQSLVMTTSDASGNYSFTNLPAGAYNVAVAAGGWMFNTASRSVNVTSANLTGVSFTARAQTTYSISGATTYGGSALSGVTIMTGGGVWAVSDGSGHYSIVNLPANTYQLTASKATYAFSPATLSATIRNANLTGKNFTASHATYRISGSVQTITNGVARPVQGVTVAAQGTMVVAYTDSFGRYTLSGLEGAQTYVVIPSRSGMGFSPSTRTVQVQGTDVQGADFVAAYNTFSITGTVTLSGAGFPGVRVGADSGASFQTASSADGSYVIRGLAPGTYVVTGSASGFAVSPASGDGTVTIVDGDALGVDLVLTPTERYLYAWDHLGTVRLVTDAATGAVVSHHDYEPYGVELTPIVNQSGNTHQFTGHERDSFDLLNHPVSNTVDYMHARYYGSNLGRFMRPDPLDLRSLMKRSMTNPQAWNLYSYVQGNPVLFTDPTGMTIQYSDAFRKKLKEDAAFRKAFERWKKTESGRKQWMAMRKDPNSTYTLTVDKLYIQGDPKKGEAAGQTNTTYSRDPEPHVDAKVTINVDGHRGDVKDMADTLFHEGRLALAAGTENANPKEDLQRLDHNLDYGGDKQYEQFQKENEQLDVPTPAITP